MKVRAALLGLGRSVSGVVVAFDERPEPAIPQN